MADDDQVEGSSEPDPPALRAYSPPTLKSLGTLTELTRGSSGTGADGMGSGAFGGSGIIP